VTKVTRRELRACNEALVQAVIDSNQIWVVYCSMFSAHSLLRLRKPLRLSISLGNSLEAAYENFVVNSGYSSLRLRGSAD